MPPGKQPGQKIRGFYRKRWGIENQGFRGLSQRWNIDRPAGHNYGSVLARLVFVFRIYNAGPLFEQACQHRTDYAAQLKRMRSYGPGVRLALAHPLGSRTPVYGATTRKATSELSTIDYKSALICRAASFRCRMAWEILLLSRKVRTRQ